jgi:DNA-binding transcriptional ArsR family regulator
VAGAGFDNLFPSDPPARLLSKKRKYKKKTKATMNKRTYHVFFSNLSTPLRVEIISALSEKDMCVNELVKKLKAEQSKLSHALSGLKKCNLVNAEYKGKLRIYSLNRKTVLPVLKLIDKHTDENCGEYCKECTMCKFN